MFNNLAKLPKILMKKFNAKGFVSFRKECKKISQYEKFPWEKFEEKENICSMPNALECDVS